MPVQGRSRPWTTEAGLQRQSRMKAFIKSIARVGEFDESSGSGIAVQIDVEDAIGVRHQIKALSGEVEELL